MEPIAVHRRAETKTSGIPILLALIGTLFFSVIVVGVLVNWSSGSDHPGLMTARVQKIASGELLVPAGQLRWITFPVTSVR